MRSRALLKILKLPGCLSRMPRCRDDRAVGSSWLYSETMPKAGGSFLLGLILCWLLNLVEIGVGLLLLFATEKYLPAVYTLIFAVGLVQVGYVVPLWRLFHLRGRGRSAGGLVWGALLTLTVNLIVNYRLFGGQMLPFPR